MIRRRIMVLLQIAALLTVWSASMQAAEVVQFWHQFGAGAAREAIDEMVTRFNDSQDEIWVEAVAMPEFQEKIQVALAAGVAPDLAYNVSVPEFSKRGLLTNLSPWMERDGVGSSDFFYGALQANTTADGVFGLPAFVALHPVLFYRTANFDSAGLSQDPPASWKELQAVSKKLTVRGSDGRYEKIGFNWGQGAAAYTLPVYHRLAGGSILDETGRKVTFGGDLGISVLNWLIDSKLTPEEDALFRRGLGDTFLGGQEAIRAAGNWWAKNFSNQGLKPGEDFGAWAVPAWDGSEQRILIGAGSNLVIPANARNPEAAWKFLKWITGRDAAAEWSLIRGILPGNRQAARDPRFRDLPFWDKFVSMAESSGIPEWTERGDVIVPADVLKIMDSAYKVAYSRSNSPLSALETAAQQAQAVLDDFLSN